MSKLFIRAALAFGFALLLCTRSQAQSIPELITELVLDEQKLGELKDILKDMYQGYQVVDKGYSNIRDIAEGNFNLHKSYLDGLLAISPTVAGYPRVAQIIDMEHAIITESQAGAQQFNANGHFTAQELGYIGNVYAVVGQQSEKSISALTMVITADQLRMSDAERMRAIDRVYGDVRGQLGFLQRFNTNTAVQAIQRLRAAGDLLTLKLMYGIQN